METCLQIRCVVYIGTLLLRRYMDTRTAFGTFVHCTTYITNFRHYYTIRIMCTGKKCLSRIWSSEIQYQSAITCSHYREPFVLT